MLQDLTVKTFASSLGSAFRIAIDPSRVLEVELIAADELRSRPTRNSDSSQRAPFTLLFRGPLVPVLPQRIYRFEHDQLGSLEFFIVPIGPDEQGMRYEAVFN